ncbi:DUF374 domain-containing protein [candidate division KSB1 bacterium]|nr:DUF374 domain-containing protein [candidate division KSB1 bacterium]
MNKKKLKRKLTFIFVSKFSWLLILLLGNLCSIKIKNGHYLKQLRRRKKRFLFLIWHGRMMLPIYIHKGVGITAMVSLHFDGEMIAQSVHRLGYKTVRGSSTRGGKQAFKEMLEVLKNGQECALMPDGPKGPRHSMKPGAISLSQQADAYLLPMTFACKRKIEFKSWDRFNLITPFSKAVVIYGKPLKAPPKMTPEQFKVFQEKVRQHMIENERKADEYFTK